MKQLPGILNLTVLEKGEAMPICEKCWNDAYTQTYGFNEKLQSLRYLELLEERKENPCQIRASEVSENQASDIVPDWKTIRPYGSLGVFHEMVEEQLKESKMQLRVGERPVIENCICNGNYQYCTKQCMETLPDALAHDKTTPLNQIIVKSANFLNLNDQQGKE